MNRRNFLSLCLVFFCSLFLSVSCTPSSETPTGSPATPSGEPVVIGYSAWAGWWPWAIAEKEGLFAKNGANVKLQWFDNYTNSIKTLAAGQLDGNCQTLNDTIAFAGNATKGMVAILVNDNSAGNDKVIVTADINSVADLKGKKVAVEEGVVDDFLLTLALQKEGLKRSDVEIVPLETGQAVAAFAAGKTDAVAAFPPFWLTALKREGSKELISSAAFPGAIPDLLVVTQELIDKRPDQAQALVNTWFDIREFMQKNPQKADEIIAERADISVEEMQEFKAGTRFFTVEDNLEAFSPGKSMKHMPFAAQEMTQFMLKNKFLDKKPDLSKILNDKFVKAYKQKKT